VWFLRLIVTCAAWPARFVGRPSGRAATEHGPPGPRAVSWFGPDGPVSYSMSTVRRRRRRLEFL